MKFNNKILLLIFVFLLGFYLMNKFLNKPEVRSFRDVLVSIDTSLVDQILYYPQGSSSQMTLSKEGNDWYADNGSKKIKALRSVVNSMLVPTASLKAKQLVSKSKDKWSEYEVDDSKGTKIELFSKGKILDAFIVGRFNFNQNTRTAKTYMRRADEDDIYSVEGFLSMTYQKSFDDFRNKKLLSGLEPQDISAISLNFNGQEFTMDKGLDNNWVSQSNASIDSLASTQYIQKLINLSGTEILDNYTAGNNGPICQLSLLSSDNVKNQKIDIYADINNGYLVNSSANSELYFKSDSVGIFKTIVTDLQELLK